MMKNKNTCWVFLFLLDFHLAQGLKNDTMEINGGLAEWSKALHC